MIVKGIFKPILSIHQIGKFKFWAGILIGIIAAIVLALFFNYSRETLRSITATSEHDLLLLPDSQNKQYDLFFSFLATTIALGVTQITWFSSPRRYRVKKDYFRKQIFRKPIKKSYMRNLSYFLLCLMLICCKGTKSFLRTDGKNSEQYDSNIIEKYSPYSQAFLKHLDKEILSNESFIPSSKLINDYSIIIIDDVYYLGAILKIREGVDEEKLKDMGIKINTKVNDIWTVNIPILQLKKIGNIEGISYIQINEPVKPKQYSP